MFEVGFTEIVLILGLALLVLGPEKLPGLAEKVGRWTGRARAMARQLRTQLEQEVNMEELAKSRPTQTPQEPSAAASATSARQAADVSGDEATEAPDAADPAADTHETICDAAAPKESEPQAAAVASEEPR